MWKGILGNHGVGNCNDNGRLLLEFCAEQELTITNTIFQQKNSHKTTWMHPRSKHWHLIDYVLVKQRDVADVFHTRVMPSAECHTDHRLVRCKVNFTFKPQQRTRQAPPRKLQVNLLRNQAVKEKFQSTLNEKLVAGEHTANQDPEAQWEQLKSTVLQTAEDTLGFSSRKHQDWFDENDQEIQKLLKEKRSAHQTYLANPSCPQRKAAFRRACSTLQRKLRVMQDTWWSDLAQKTQMYADQGDYAHFNQALRAIYGPTYQTLSPLRSADGKDLLTDKEAILARWSEYFQGLFSVDRTVQDSALDSIPQKPIITEMDEPPTLGEITKAIGMMKTGKASGIDGIPPEIWINGGPILHSQLHKFLTSCWINCTLPSDLRNAVVIALYKNKGEKSDCSNYRGITLLSIAGKILARILLNRLTPTIAEAHLPESQCSFRTQHGTSDMVFVLRQLQEKCREQNLSLFITFVDLAKAFDTVSRKGLWAILGKLGCPPKFLTMITQLHEGQLGQVRHGNDLSQPFHISNGVKQGCVLAPTLFSIFFSMMLEEAMKDLDKDEGVYIRFRTDGSLFNLRRLQAHTKTTQRLIRELLFADDAALVTHTERALQRLTSCFAAACELFGLAVSIKKTEVLHQPAPLSSSQPPSITINGTPLKTVQQFCYLGSIISTDARIDKEVDNRLAKANSAFGRLRRRVWNNNNLKTHTKVRVYKAVVLTTLLYGSESWVRYRCHVRLLERFHQRCLRIIFNIHWSDHVSNVEVLERANTTSIEATLLKTQLRWAGHVSRMEDHRLPKAVLFGELSSGYRNRGAPRKRFKDSLKKSLACCGIDSRHWTTMAEDRARWRNTIRKASNTFEPNRREALKEKRARRKNSSQAALPPEMTFPCSRCNRMCRSRIGLVSHQRACFRRQRPT